MKLKILHIVFFLLLISCKEDFDKDENKLFIIKKIKFDNDDRYTESFGLMNNKGGQLVELNSRRIYSVANDYFIGEKENLGKQYFRINKESLLFERNFEEANLFDENGLAKVKSKGKWGFINTKGDFVVPPLYDFVGEFFEDRCAIVVEDKVGFINLTGRIIIEPKYDLPEDLGFSDPEFQLNIYRYKNGLCRVNLQGNYGYIDTEGNILIQAVYAKAMDFVEEYAVVGTKENEDIIYGIINRKGEWKIKPQFGYILLTKDYFLGSIQRLRDPNNLFDFFSLDYDRFSYFNLDGSKMIDKEFQMPKYPEDLSLHVFSEDKAFVCPNNSCGYINKIGEFVISPKYFKPQNGVLFKYERAVVATNSNDNSIAGLDGKNYSIVSYRPVGIIDVSGNLVIPPVFVDAIIHSPEVIEVVPKDLMPKQHLLKHVFYIDSKGNYLWNGYEGIQ